MNNALASEHSAGFTIQRFCQRDITDVALLLNETGLCDTHNSHDRLVAFTGPQACAFCARTTEGLVGAALGIFNGFHVFLSHLAVANRYARGGVGSLLHTAILREAQERNAIGIIADAWLSSAGWFQKQGYRTPGAVFLLKDISFL